MDKTISISLGGFSFIIDENAYAKLKIYLQDVRTSLHGTEGVEDIIEDVEIRIAELFRERIKFREVVSNDDVDFVIATMGHPNQYKVEEDDVDDAGTNSSYSNPTYEAKQNKRLFRDPDDKVMTGLSAGIAHYLGLDPWAVRAAWIICGILTLIPGGFPVFAVIVFYIALLFFVPKAKTTSEKLQMYGKPANIETLKKNAEQASEAVISGGRELSNKLGGAFGVLAKIILWFIGFIILMTGIGLIIGGCAIAFTTWMDVPTELFGYLIEEQWMSMTSKILGGFLMIIPGILLTLLGIRCFTKIKTSKALIIGSVVVWFIALFTILGFTASTASKFRNSVELTNDHVLNVPSDTLVVQFNDKNYGQYIFKSVGDLDQLFDNDGNLIVNIDDEIKLKESDNNEFKLELKFSSKGGSTEEAKRNVESIVYNHILNGNVLNLDEFIKIKKDGKFRNQNLKISLYVPKGKVVHVKNMDEVSVSNQNEDKNYYAPSNNYFLNTGEKIVCLNCKKEESDYEEEDLEIEGFEIDVNDSEENANFKFDRNGIRIEGDNGSIGVTTKKNKPNNNQINYKDDTDSIHINYRNNQDNR